MNVYKKTDRSISYREQTPVGQQREGRGGNKDRTWEQGHKGTRYAVIKPSIEIPYSIWKYNCYFVIILIEGQSYQNIEELVLQLETNLML